MGFGRKITESNIDAIEVPKNAAKRDRWRTKKGEKPAYYLRIRKVRVRQMRERENLTKEIEETGNRRGLDKESESRRVYRDEKLRKDERRNC